LTCQRKEPGRPIIDTNCHRKIARSSTPHSIGHAVVAARKYAERVGGRQTFHNVLAEQQIMPPLDKATISRLEKIMGRLNDVVTWQATLPEHQRIAWAGPTSIINRCPSLQPPPPSAPRKPTRLESAQ
jgi:hypothetical protein